MSRAIGLIVLGQNARSDDPDFWDAVFIWEQIKAERWTWTWDSFQNIRARVLRILTKIQTAKVGNG